MPWLFVILNLDGFDEIVAGSRGKPHQLKIYQFDLGAKKWIINIIDNGSLSAAGLVISDFNNDGLMDIAAAGSQTNNVVLYTHARTALP